MPKNSLNEPTCYKNASNPTCIVLIMTNRPKSFQNSSIFENGLSDFHKINLSVFKVSFQRQPSEVFCKKKYSWKFRKIHRKTPVPESLFNKVVGSCLQLY